VKGTLAAMTGTTLHFVEGSWPGRLALAARPRGGDWLADEIRAWQRAGIGVVCSLLTRAEEVELELTDEETVVRAAGMMFLSLPIEDRQVPVAEQDVDQALDSLERELSAGRNVVLHCRQGIGRTGLIAACLFLKTGEEPAAIVKRLSAARGISVPETAEQRTWIDRYARTTF
jgi:protein-tyrosine phosphatase